jgi:hypothetical protein
VGRGLGGYLDSHAELSHDHRQAPIRMEINRELAAVHERINWDACVSWELPKQITLRAP